MSQMKCLCDWGCLEEGVRPQDVVMGQGPESCRQKIQVAEHVHEHEEERKYATPHVRVYVDRFVVPVEPNALPAASVSVVLKEHARLRYL